MSRTEPELWSALGQADQMEFGEAQQALLETVVRHADAGGFPRLAFTARRHLANAYSVDRQWDKAFPLFSRCLSDYDQRPWEFGPEEDYTLRRWYTTIAQSMAEFPEISLSQVFGAFDDMEGRFRAGGHNLREVHGARRWVAQLVGDWDEEERCYQQWTAAGGADPRSVWDFEAEVERLVMRGDEASLVLARELAAPVLAGQVSFDEPPAPIQCLMLLPLLRVGALAEAAQAYRRSMRAMAYDVYRYEYSGMQIEFCALTGNEDAGLSDLKPRLHGFPTLNRPNGKMEFAASVAVLLRRMVEAGRGGELVGCACGQEPPRPVAALKEEMTRIALDLAARFDARNGTPSQGDRVRSRLGAQPVIDYLALAPTSRKPARVAIRTGLAPEQAVDAAEWHLRGYEGDVSREYLATIADPPPPHLAARIAELRAILDWNPGSEAPLRWAADAHRNAGDHRRHLLCLCWLGRWLAENQRADEGLGLVSWAVGELHRTGDPWGIAYGELRLAQVLVILRQPGAYPAIERAGQFAVASGDPLAVGVIADLEAYWRDGDGAPPDHVIRLATTAKDALVAAGAFGKTSSAFERLKSAYGRAGTPGAFTALVNAQLANLPPSTPPQVVAYLRYERGRALLAAGRGADALPDLTAAVADDSSRGEDRAEQWYHLAVACHGCGRYEDAVDAAAMCAGWLGNLRRQGQLEDPGMADRARLILAQSHERLGEAEAALEHYTRLVDEARELGNQAVVVQGAAALGELLARLGRDGEAGRWLREAAEAQADAARR